MRRRPAVAVVALGITMAVAGCTSPTAQPQADSTTPAAMNRANVGASAIYAGEKLSLIW